MGDCLETLPLRTVDAPHSDPVCVARTRPFTAHLREGPGIDYARAGIAVQGTVLIGTGRAPSNEPYPLGPWLEIAHEGRTLWIHAPLTDVGDCLETLPLRTVTASLMWRIHRRFMRTVTAPVTALPAAQTAQPMFPGAPLRPPPVPQTPLAETEGCTTVTAGTSADTRRGPRQVYPVVHTLSPGTVHESQGHHDAEGQRWYRLGDDVNRHGYAHQVWLPQGGVQAACARSPLAEESLPRPFVFTAADESERWDWEWQLLPLWDGLQPFMTHDAGINHLHTVLHDYPFGTSKERVHTMYYIALVALPEWPTLNLEWPISSRYSAGPRTGARWADESQLVADLHFLHRIDEGNGVPFPVPDEYSEHYYTCLMPVYAFRGNRDVIDCHLYPIWGQGGNGPLAARMVENMVANAFRAASNGPGDVVDVHRWGTLDLVQQDGQGPYGFPIYVDTPVLTLTQRQPWPWE